MNRRKCLNKYKDKYMLFENDDFLYYIDNFLWYHKKHLKLRKCLDKAEALGAEGYLEWIKKSNIDVKQVNVNVFIKSFFRLIIIELSKFIESDKDFEAGLNKNIVMECPSYERFYRKDNLNNKEPVKKIDCISLQIIHYRDACVHNEDKGISNNAIHISKNNLKNVISKGYEIYTGIDGKSYVMGYLWDLDFICHSDTREWVFCIGNGQISFNKLLEIIKYALDYYYIIPDNIREHYFE